MKALVHGLAGLTLFTLASAALAQDAVTLRYQPSKDPLVYKKTSTLKQEQALMGKKIITTADQTEIDVWNSSVNDKKELVIKGETKSLMVKIKNDMIGNYTFDSRKDDNEKDVQEFHGCVPSKKTAHCSPVAIWGAYRALPGA